jgi:Hg(II)-responsive transcriptional regulator
MKTGQLAREAEVNVETIRYYERMGLLPVPPRRESGYREYSKDDLSRIRFIKRAQDLGFSLKEIAELLDLRAVPHADNARVKKLAVEKVADIERRIRDLERMRESLRHIAGTCDGSGTVEECPILRAIEDAAPCCH